METLNIPLLLLHLATAFSQNLQAGNFRRADYGQTHPCSRPCELDSAPMTCYYNFTVESKHTLSTACFDCPFNQTDCFRPDCIPGDGIKRSVTVINRMLPGPAVQVCKGDNIVIRVKNHILGEQTTIHWHGMHQVDTPHQDGVPMVTQCPTPSGNTFTYTFKATPPGTHFYHSHSAIQRADGLYGAFIVREPLSEDPHGKLYDYDLEDHIIVLSDWMVKMARSRFTGHFHGQEDAKAVSALINGLGVYENFTGGVTTPRKVYYVTSGKRYRMRVISNAVFSCPIQFSVDGHNMTMIASDGKPFESFEVESFIIHPGERYDFILYALMLTPGNYWMRLHGLDDCANKFVHQEAILRYSDAPDKDPDEPTDYEYGARDGMQLNPLDSGLSENKIPVSEMTYSYPNEEDADQLWAKPEADSKYYIDYDFSYINNPHYNDPMWYPIDPTNPNRIATPQIGYRSLIFPPSPLLTQYEDIPKDMFCDNDDSVTDSRCTETYCECLNVIKIKLGDVTELFLIDRGETAPGATHPFHLHGYSARIISYDKVGQNISIEDIKEMDEKGEIRRNLNRTVQKDTLAMPSGGFGVLRFHANNPGFWLLHCHIDFHLDLGMGLIVQVGEVSEMKPKPKKFPTCGNWEFDGYVSGGEQPGTADFLKIVIGTGTLMFIYMNIPFHLIH